MCIDIDALKRLQDRQGMLVAELQHRTRNLIAVVKGMADQTLRASETMQHFKATFDERLQALSRVQGMLSRADQEPISIGALVRLELDAMGAGEDKDRVMVEGPEIFLPKGVVQTFALAVHELATNATKYGALANDHGRLVVAWRETAGETGPRLFLDWEEQGLDLERELKGPMTKGFGRQLIEEALPYAHGARTSFVLNKTGVRCTIDLPLGT
jgi:two-component system, chemotaxis family, CheB/CheR fusion protein